MNRVFIRDDGATEVDVDFSVSGGEAPSGLSGPPEDYDPGSGFEVEIESATRLEGEDDGPGRKGDPVTLTDKEFDRFQTEVNEDPETWEPDEAPDRDDDFVDF